jgi:hypothetical protein
VIVLRVGWKRDVALVFVVISLDSLMPVPGSEKAGQYVSVHGNAVHLRRHGNLLCPCLSDRACKGGGNIWGCLGFINFPPIWIHFLKWKAH